MDLFSSLTRVLPSNILLLVIVGLVLGVGGGIVYYYMLGRGGRRTVKGRGRKKSKAVEDYDLVAYAIDERTGEIHRFHMVKLTENIYGSLDSEQPIYYINLGDRIYNLDGEKTVIGRLYDILIYPVIPDVETASNLIRNAPEEDIVELNTKSAIDFLKGLHEHEKIKTGSVVVPPIGKLMFSIKPLDFAVKLLESTVVKAIQLARSLMRMSREMDKFIEYLHEKAEYEKARHIKWQYIVAIVSTLVVFIIIAMALYMNMPHKP